MRNIRISVVLIAFCYLGLVTMLMAQSKAEQISKHLNEAVKNKDSKARIRAINEIGELGALQAKLGEPAVPVFTKLLDDKDAKVRAAVILNIVRLDIPDRKPLIEKLTKMLKEDSDEAVREASATALGIIGPDAKSAVPVIREALAKTKDKQDMRIYQDALKSITGRKK